MFELPYIYISFSHIKVSCVVKRGTTFQKNMSNSSLLDILV